MIGLAIASSIITMVAMFIMGMHMSDKDWRNKLLNNKTGYWWCDKETGEVLFIIKSAREVYLAQKEVSKEKTNV